MRPLPPFDGLVAFDAVLRHGSATEAADALGLTQSAISHRLRRLERFFGMPLLARHGARLGPTPAGAALAPRLADLLDELSRLPARARGAVQPAGLRVAVGAALADRWLVRRLPAFGAGHRGLAIELVVLHAESDARRIEADVEIVWARGERVRDGATQRRLFVERVFPVAAPRWLPDGAPLADPRAIATLPRLHKGSASASVGAEWSWQTWFDRLGLGIDPGPALRFDSIGTAIAACQQGAGVALARSLLVHDALHDGHLVRVLDAAWDLPSTKVHLVRWPAALVGDERVVSFVRWITREALACGHAMDAVTT